MTDQEIQAKGEEMDKAISFIERLLAMEKTTAELAEAKAQIETLKAKVKSAEFLLVENDSYEWCPACKEYTTSDWCETERRTSEHPGAEAYFCVECGEER